jgi:hypothetical protein
MGEGLLQESVSAPVGIPSKRMMNSNFLSTGMPEKPFCIVLDPDLEEPIRKLTKRGGSKTPDSLVNSALRMFIDAVQGTRTIREDLAYENEILRRRMKELEQQIGQKDEKISVLLKLWEQCPMKKGERDVPPELEEKISRLLQDWYFETERKDFSGANGSKHGRV